MTTATKTVTATGFTYTVGAITQNSRRDYAYASVHPEGGFRLHSTREQAAKTAAREGRAVVAFR